MTRAALWLLGCLGVGGAGCSAPDVPQHPTWVQVEPILRARCASCHGASAPLTGNGVRFDFYDMNADLCGDAAKALDPNIQLGGALAVPIWNAITTTPDRPTTRPRMPPEPASYLAEWEWKTVRDWVDDEAPKGQRPYNNGAARIQLYGNLASADQSLDLTAVVEDPDGDPVVGVLNIGDPNNGGLVLKMDRAGAFSATIDTSGWAAGPRAISTVLCDGWSSVH
jgi:hypothetical protein